MTSYFCKRFVPTGKRGKGEWQGLGVVYANDGGEAWAKALARWGTVDSVYPLHYCD